MSDRVTLADVEEACDRTRDAAQRTKEACDAMLDRGTLWLALHPFKCREMRQRIKSEKRAMLAERDEMLRRRDLFLAHPS